MNILKNIVKKFSKEDTHQNYTKSFYLNLEQPVWTDRSYLQFAQQGFVKNVVAYRAVNMIAQGASTIPIKVYGGDDQVRLDQHEVLGLLQQPNPQQSLIEFLEAIYLYRLISGNTYIFSTCEIGKMPKELYVLRPDRVQVIPGKNFLPKAFRYSIGKNKFDYGVDAISGIAKILHIKNFHPSSDWYGLSPIEAAAYSIDQHNSAAAWNQSLLQNGARPSGAIVVKEEKHISEEQFSRLKEQVNENFSGFKNAGKPMILEGGLAWQDISLSPKDMDFIHCKNSAARDIALAFGVPPQMLGIPGDSTYNTYAEARIALWEQRIIPYAEDTTSRLSHWLSNLSGQKFTIKIDKDNIPILAEKREQLWERVRNADFMTVNEKRQQFGLAPMTDRDNLSDRS